MRKCKYCKYYNYDREIYFYANSRPLSAGVCTYFDGGGGHRVFDCDCACEYFIEQENTFCKGDVLQNDNEVLFIESINESFFPRKYRVRNNYNTSYSMSAEELIQCKLLIRGEKESEEE